MRHDFIILLDFVIKNNDLFEEAEEEPHDVVDGSTSGRRLVKKLNEKMTPTGLELEFEDTGEIREDDLTYYTQEDYEKGELKAGPDSFFDDLKKTMFPITPPGNGEIWKSIQKKGGDEQMPKKCKLEFHCSFYAEGNDEPFDSSEMRAEPWQISMLDINFVGLQYALYSMKIGEKSRFLIPPKYAFGRRGVPPRIPPNCTVLADVELLNWVDITGRTDFFSLTYEERRDALFEIRKSAVDNLNDDAKIKYKQSYFMAASKIYRKVQTILEEARLTSDEEEAEQRRLLVKAYVNRAVCNIHLKNPKYVICDTKSALMLDPKCGKALYLLGKAHRFLENYDKARKCLLRAQKLVSRQEEISKELEKLDRLERKWTEKEKALYRSMFAGFNGHSKKKSEPLSKKQDGKKLNESATETQLKPSDPKEQGNSHKRKEKPSRRDYKDPNNNVSKRLPKSKIKNYIRVPWIEDFLDDLTTSKGLDTVGFTPFEIESLVAAVKRRGYTIEKSNKSLFIRKPGVKKGDEDEKQKTVSERELKKSVPRSDVQEINHEASESGATPVNFEKQKKNKKVKKSSSNISAKSDVTEKALNKPESTEGIETETCAVTTEV